MRKLSLSVLLVAALCLVFTLPLVAQGKIEIRIAGADSMWGRISGLSRLWTKDHPEYDIAVARNSLVEEGMMELIEGKADVAMASRRAIAGEQEAAKEKGIQLVEHLIGYGGVVIISDRANPVGELTIEQISRIFTGELSNWKQVGGKDQPITVFFTAKKHPGTLLFFQEAILGGATITKDAVDLPDFPTLMGKVANTPGAVAYVRIRDPFESQAGRNTKIKPLKIKKDATSPPINPARETVKDGTYPLRRPYFLYTTGSTKKEVLDLVQFVVSKGWGAQDLTYMWQ